MSLPLAKRLVSAIDFTGLLPLSIQFHPMHAKPSKRAVIRSLVTATILCPLTTVCLVILLWLYQSQLFLQTTLVVTISGARIIGVLRTYMYYFVQIRRRHEIASIFNEVCSIRVRYMDAFGAMFNDDAFLDRKCGHMVKWKIGSLIVQFSVVMFGLNLYKIGDPDDAFLRVLVKTFHSIGTDVLTLIYSTMNFSVTLVALQFFRSINARLAETVAVVRELLLCRRQADAKVRLHCNITDEIDCIAGLYDSVLDYANRATDIFAIPVVMTLMNSFLFSLVAIYSLVHDIGKLVEFEDDGQPPQVLFNVLCLVYFATEIYFLVWLSDAVIEEANKTGRILCRTASFEIDKKTKECIEIFSLSILQGRQLMVPCGMFTVDKTLVYGMVGALTSYLTILIQFDLASNSSARNYSNATI